MNNNKLSPKRFIVLSSKTVIGFVVFVLFLYTVPIYNNAKEVFAGRATNYVVVGETTVNVVIADTPKKRQAGLSIKKTLKDHEGMFFIFDAPADNGIWMKNMNFSIDIIC